MPYKQIPRQKTFFYTSQHFIETINFNSVGLKQSCLYGLRDYTLNNAMLEIVDFIFQTLEKSLQIWARPLYFS